LSAAILKESSVRGMSRRFLLSIMIAAASATIASSGARAAEPKPPPSIWEQPTLTGDWGGARTALHDKGIDITLNYIGETFAVLSGGIDRRASYEGQLEFTVDTDLQKLVGWTGASTHLTVYQIHDSGSNVIQNVGSISDPSNIDALPTTRLFTGWFQQNFAGDAVSLRIGQILADGEFMISPTAGGLLNGTFGWDDLFGANMVSGGPAYPLATPGALVKVKASDEVTVQAAVFSGNPAGANCHDDPQECNKHGTTFSFAGGSLWMGEVQYAVNQGKNAAGLPGVYKLGGWYATANFADQHFGIDASGATVSLGVDPAADPVQHRGDWGIYGVADQMVWRAGERSLNLFLRGGLAPADRNLVSYYVDGGAGFTGLLPGRANDVLTFGVAYAKISPDAAAADRDAFAAMPPYPIRDYELVFELSYTAQIAPWWTVQPDLQFIVHPGGNASDPDDLSGAPVANAFVAGIRSTIKF
jgi:porin